MYEEDLLEVVPLLPEAGVLPDLPYGPIGPRFSEAAYIMQPVKVFDINTDVLKAVSAGLGTLEYDCLRRRAEPEAVLAARFVNSRALLEELFRHGVQAPLLCHARDSLEGYMLHEFLAATYAACGGPICAWVRAVLLHQLPSALAVLEVLAYDTHDPLPTSRWAVHVYLLRYVRESHTLLFHDSERECVMEAEEALVSTHDLQDLVPWAETVHARLGTSGEAKHWTSWLRRVHVAATATKSDKAVRATMSDSALFDKPLLVRGREKRRVAAPLQMLAERLHERMGLTCGFCTEGLEEGLSLDACVACAVHLCKWVERLGDVQVAHVQSALLHGIGEVARRTCLPPERVMRQLLSDVPSYTTLDCASSISAYDALQALQGRTERRRMMMRRSRSLRLSCNERRPLCLPRSKVPWSWRIACTSAMVRPMATFSDGNLLVACV